MAKWQVEVEKDVFETVEAYGFRLSDSGHVMFHDDEGLLVILYGAHQFRTIFGGDD